MGRRRGACFHVAEGVAPLFCLEEEGFSAMADRLSQAPGGQYSRVRASCTHRLTRTVPPGLAGATRNRGKQGWGLRPQQVFLPFAH